MSILISDMEMPTDGCHHMICIYADGTVSTGGRVYKGITVPPHGRLIDADELLKPENQHLDVFADEWYVTVRTIETAPTILEAEEGE